MKAYPAYKESDIKWIGDIPKHWEIRKLKRFSSIVNGSTPQSTTTEYWDGDIVWVTPVDLGGLKKEKIIIDSARKITKLGLNSCGTSMTPKGSIILSTRAPIGHLAIAGTDTCTNQGCKTIVPDQNQVSNSYLYYYLFVFDSLPE
jgi:type I restriction enzyme S subunit